MTRKDTIYLYITISHTSTSFTICRDPMVSGLPKRTMELQGEQNIEVRTSKYYHSYVGF